jgi:hypothetical protein
MNSAIIKIVLKIALNTHNTKSILWSLQEGFWIKIIYSTPLMIYNDAYVVPKIISASIGFFI